MHGVERPLYRLAFGDKEGGFAVLAATAGEDGVDFGAAGIAGHYWVQA